MNVAIYPSLGRRRRIGPNVTRIAVRQVEREEVGPLLDPADDRNGFAEIRLGVARGVVQRHEHLLPAPLMIAHVVLDDGVAALEALALQPLPNLPST